jgi:hypothetical protein
MTLSVDNLTDDLGCCAASDAESFVCVYTTEHLAGIMMMMMMMMMMMRRMMMMMLMPVADERDQRT